MAAFAQFGSDLDAATQKQLNRGARLVELLKQGQYQPLSVEQQVVIIFAGTNGFVDELPIASLKKYEQELFAFIDSKHPDVFADILKKRELDGDLRAKLSKVLGEFKGVFKA
jgi:F-type H+-transporting ATPase subunit alpha